MTATKHTTTDLLLITREYLRNEENNDHTGNFVLLAEHFGTAENLFMARCNEAFAEQFGYINGVVNKQCYENLNQFYYDHLLEFVIQIRKTERV